MPKSSLVNTLNEIAPHHGGTTLKVLSIYGDQPDVLNAIVDARKRRCSFRQIATAISTDGVVISPAAIQAFLNSRGVA